MFLWWLGGSRDQQDERTPGSPKAARGRKGSASKRSSIGTKRMQQQEDDLVGLASLVRNPPTRATPPRSPPRSPSSSPHPRTSMGATPTRSTLESPTSVRRVKYSQWSVVNDNREIAEDTRHSLEQLAHRSDLTQATITEIFQKNVDDARASRAAIPTNRAAVQKHNRAIVLEAREIRDEVLHYREAHAAATEQWGRVNRYNEQLQRFKISKSKAEVASMNKKAAVQAIAQRQQRRELLAGQARQELEKKRRMVQQVSPR